MSVIDNAKKKMDNALDRLKHVKTQEELRVVQSDVEVAKNNLLKVSDDFRASSIMNAATMRSQAMTGMPMGGMGAMGMTGAMVPPGGIARPSVSIDNEQIWACRRCGSKNVNWKKVGGRKVQRAYVKRTGIKKSLLVDGAIRYCIMCTQELGRDQVFERISLKELREISKDLSDKKAKEIS